MLKTISNVEQLIDFYARVNIGYVVDRVQALDKCTHLESTKEAVLLSNFIENATDSQYIAFLGNAYYKHFHDLEIALIQASNFSTKELSPEQIDLIVSSKFNGQLGNVALQKMITQLGIKLKGKLRSPDEIENEKKEKLKRAETVIIEYKVPQFQKRLIKNDLMCFLNIYDFLNYKEHIKLKDLEFPATPFSSASSFEAIRGRIDYLRAHINGKSDNTSFKIYDNLLIELDKYFKTPASKEKYDVAISFDEIRKLLKKNISESDALEIISNWSKYSTNRDEVRRFVSSLYIKRTGLELEIDKIEKIDYFHCLCGRMIPDYYRKCCPVCHSRNKIFNSIELDNYLLDVLLKLGMFETARLSNICPQKVENFEKETFKLFYQFFSDKQFYNAITEIRNISDKYKLFENIEWNREEFAKKAIDRTEKLVQELPKNTNSKEKIQELIIEIYKTTVDYPRIEQVCLEYVGVNFSKFIKSVELLKIDMNGLSVILTDRFGMGYDLRLKIDSELLNEISKIHNFQVILVEGLVDKPEEGRNLSPFYLDSSFELFKKKIKLLASEIKSKNYTLFFSNGESYSNPKHFQVT